MEPAPAAPLAPAPDTRRAVAPDLARGLMLAPIALANVMIYLHARPYGLRQHIVEFDALDRVVTALMVTLVDGRAYPLFAALLGLGLARIAARQSARGMSDAGVAAVLRRRSWWLLAFGLVHAMVAFSGDVLGLYALIGLVLAGRMRIPDRTLLWVAGGWLVLASIVPALTYSDATITTQRTILWSFAIEDPLAAALWRPLEWAMTPIGLLTAVSSVLVGVWAARHGILTHPSAHLTLLWRTAVIGISAGVLGGLGMALATVQLWHPPFWMLLPLSWLHVTTGVLGGLGYAAAIALWTLRIDERPRPVIDALRATGQRSLSCYLAQTVVFAALLPAWSLGWGATLSTTGAALIALATWALTVVGAVLLQRAGRAGPAEALLRRLCRRRSTPARARL